MEQKFIDRYIPGIIIVYISEGDKDIEERDARGNWVSCLCLGKIRLGEEENGGNMTLDQLKVGQSGVIAQVGGEGALRRRLLDMGLTPKTKVMVRKKAPLGDPIELHLRGYELTIRQEDAAKIEMAEERQ